MQGQMSTRQIERGDLPVSTGPFHYTDTQALLALVVAYCAIGPLTDIAKLHHIAQFRWVWLVYVYAPVPILVAAASIYTLMRKSTLVDWYAKFLLCMGAFGFGVGLIRANSLRYLVPDLGRIAFVVTMYLAFSNMRLRVSSITRLIHSFNRIVLFCYSITIAFIYLVSMPRGWDLYLSVQTSPLLFPTAYYYWKKNWRSLLLTILLIALSGKRGVVLSTIAMLTFLRLARKYKTFSKQMRRLMIAGALSIAVFFGGLFIISEYVPPSLVPRAVARWQYSLPFSEKFDPFLGTSGRWPELVSAVKAIRENPLNLWIGGGHGFSYRLTSERWNIETHHNVHFSPVGMVATYGLPITILFYLALMRLLGPIYTARPADLHYETVWATFFGCAVGLLVWTCFQITLLQDPLLWMLLGLLSSTARYAVISCPIAQLNELSAK